LNTFTSAGVPLPSGAAEPASEDSPSVLLHPAQRAEQQHRCQQQAEHSPSFYLHLRLYTPFHPIGLRPRISPG